MSKLTKPFLSAILISTCLPVAFAKDMGPRLPTLAVTVSAEQVSGRNGENLEDLLMIELANQPFLQIVDRQKLQDVLKEHAIALGNKPDAKEAVALGKFAGADYLLHVLAEKEKKTAAIRLVEVASGQVKLEEQVALTDDLALSTAAIREKVLAAVRPESQAANRLTVGIAAFPNRSGTDRSDKLGIELQKALRSRLKDETWAVVLERQYPTALLEEVDLARAGLVRDNAVEKLPPADLVILGTLEDADKEYEPGKSWAVKLDLTLRLRDKTSQSVQTYHSDAVEAAADDVMRKIHEFRNQLTTEVSVPEKELWRRQALYLMPRPMLSGYENAIIPEFYGWCTNDISHVEVIRAWENVLLLDDKHPEAMTNLAVCWIGFSRWFYNDRAITGERRATLVDRWIAASRLLERAMEIEPAKERAATYLYCLRPMIDAVPARAKGMAQYVQSHPEYFAGIPESPWIKVALTDSSAMANDDRYVQLDHILANGAKDPDAVLISLQQGLTRDQPIKRVSKLLNEYQNSPDPVVQFAVHRALGEWLFGMKQDPRCLQHFDKAIAVLEAAYAKCKSPYRDSLNNIYRLKIEACLFFHRPEEAKKTAWAGARHFMDVGRFDSSEHFNASSYWFYESYIGWLYQYCVTEAIDESGEEQALALCDRYLASAKSEWALSAPWPRVSARREELLARLTRKPLPDMSGLKLVAGCAGCKSMAARAGTLWCLPSSGGGLSKVEGDQIAAVPGVPNASNFGLAVTHDAVYCSAVGGLYKLDLSGKLLKHYAHGDTGLPGHAVGCVCEGDGKIYFSFHGSPRNGIAVLDLATDKVTVLAPSSHEATAETEPVGDCANSIAWDAAARRLFVQNYFHRSYGSPVLTSVYCWSAENANWRKLPLDEAPHFIVSSGNETLLARPSGDKTEFRFVKSGEKLEASVPVPTLLGRPAWDERHIWAPTASGLYEIDRTSGRTRWLAYEDDNFFRSVLEANGRLYVATSRGLYYRDISAESATATEAKPATATTSLNDVASGAASIAFPVNISLEDNAQAEVSVQLDQQTMRQKTLPGDVQVKLPMVRNGGHCISFYCPGYTRQWCSVTIAEGKTAPEQMKVKLFRKRYVILRCAFNRTGDRNLEGDDVEEQRLAVASWTGPKYLNRDWWVWPRLNDNNPTDGDSPYFVFHHFTTDVGFEKPSPGVTYEQMCVAPASGYRCENIQAKKGLVLYCRYNVTNREGVGYGHLVQRLGYGKLMVEEVTEKPPEDVQVVEKL